MDKENDCGIHQRPGLLRYDSRIHHPYAVLNETLLQYSPSFVCPHFLPSYPPGRVTVL